MANNTPETTGVVPAAGGLRMRYVLAAGLELAAIIAWASSKMSWITIHATDDKAGEQVRQLTGASWAEETLAGFFVITLCAVVCAALSSTIRRVACAVAVVVAVALAVRPVALIMHGVNLDRARQLLVTLATSTKAHSMQPLSSWAQVSSGQVHVSGPIVALVAALVAVLVGIAGIVRPGRDIRDGSRFVRGSAVASGQAATTAGGVVSDDADRQRHAEGGGIDDAAYLAQDRAVSPDDDADAAQAAQGVDKARLMWDELDAGIDPTDAPR